VGTGTWQIIESMGVTKFNKTQLILDQIYNTNKVYDIQGKEYSLNSNIDREEGEFIGKLIRDNLFDKTVEIGCAYGISSLYICNALHPNASNHIIIDPYQSTDWNNIGIDQLNSAGFNNFKLIEKRSEVALPCLLELGTKFNFAFVDGWHTFDHTLIDMFYLNQMLEVGGMIVIDDVGMKGVKKAVNYFLNYPAYKLEGGIKLKNTISRNLFNKYVTPSVRAVIQTIPSKFREEILSEQILNKGINGYSMVALKKVKEDERPWNWYSNF
jgi:predicted O-methyltransferase YrrM